MRIQPCRLMKPCLIQLSILVFALSAFAGPQAFAATLQEVLERIPVKLVGPGVVSTPGFEYGCSISPDGNTLFFTKGISGFDRTSIVYSKKVDGKWQEPRLPSFSGEWKDGNPYFSKDGKRLYFSSNRPTGNPELKRSNWWRVEIEGDVYGEPTLVPGAINGEHSMIYPTITADGTAYFCTFMPDGKGGLDFYQSEFRDGEHQAPVPMDKLNTEYHDADPEFSPDGRFFAFTSTRSGGLGDFDLYICKVSADGEIGEPINLGKSINNSSMNSDPIFSKDGRTLYFSSNVKKGWRKHPKRVESYAELANTLNVIDNGLMNIYEADISELISFLSQ